MPVMILPDIQPAQARKHLPVITFVYANRGDCRRIRAFGVVRRGNVARGLNDLRDDPLPVAVEAPMIAASTVHRLLPDCHV